MFNRSKKLQNKAKALAKKRKQVQDFFSNPKNLKVCQEMGTASRITRILEYESFHMFCLPDTWVSLQLLQQYVKVFIGNIIFKKSESF